MSESRKGNKKYAPNKGHLKPAFLKALEARGGILMLACRDVGINTMTFYNWQNKDDDFFKKSEAIRDALIGSMAEDQLVRAIHNGNMKSVHFYLSVRSRRYRREEPKGIFDGATVAIQIVSMREGGQGYELNPTKHVGTIAPAEDRATSGIHRSKNGGGDIATGTQ